MTTFGFAVAAWVSRDRITEQSKQIKVIAIFPIVMADNSHYRRSRKLC
jgi:hypothetical protein